jgi:hypothetical protein
LVHLRTGHPWTVKLLSSIRQGPRLSLVGLSGILQGWRCTHIEAFLSPLKPRDTIRFIFLSLAPLLPELLEFCTSGQRLADIITKNAVKLTCRSSFTPVALHDDMGIEVIKGTVAFCAARPRAVIQTLNLIITAAGTFSDCVSRKRNKGVCLGYRWIGGSSVLFVL